MTQEVRNKIYTVVAGLFAIALIYGVVDQATADQSLDVLNRVLDLVPLVIGLYTSALAAWKSRPSKVAVVEVPLKQVEKVITPAGVVLAGPASPLPDGTVI